MGQVIIEVPQNVNRFYQVENDELAARLLRDLDELEQKIIDGENSAVLPPRRNSLIEDLEAVSGIWADREESAEDIARRIRDRNNGKDV